MHGGSYVPESGVTYPSQWLNLVCLSCFLRAEASKCDCQTLVRPSKNHQIISDVSSYECDSLQIAQGRESLH